MAEVYDDLVPQILEQVSVGAGTLATILDGMGQSPDAAFSVARIEREREAAASRFVRDRDFTALDGTMARLDAEESEVRARDDSIRPEQAIAWLQNLPALWHAADDSGRRMLTEAIFEKVEVLGVQSMRIHPTPEADAHGWSVAFGTEPRLLNWFSTYGRGERICAETKDQPGITAVNVPRGRTVAGLAPVASFTSRSRRAAS